MSAAGEGDSPQRVRFDADGLVPAIVQDAETGRVLTLAWMNAESLARLSGEGVELRAFPADFLAAAKQASTEVMAELAAKDELTGRIVASYAGAARHQAQWSSVSVQSFLAARA